MLLDFFKNSVINIRGVKVLLERMDDVRELSISNGIADFSNISTKNQIPKIDLEDESMTASTIDPGNLSPSELAAMQTHKNSVIRENHFPEPSDQGPRDVNYMLFLKEPNRVDEKKLKASKLEIMALESKEEK